MPTILVCDDDKQIVEAINIYLTGEGFNVIKAYDGYEALELLEKNEVNLMIVDVMMPGLDGIRTTLKVRETSSIPIIILSAKSEDTDKILGLNIGADDYITKPFDVLELISRIKAVLRRKPKEEDEQKYEYGGICLDNKSRSVVSDGREVQLTYKEYELLKLLMHNAGIVLTREKIMERVWDTEFEGESRTVDMHIKTLRKKLGDSSRHIKTVRNVGYVME